MTIAEKWSTTDDPDYPRPVVERHYKCDGCGREWSERLVGAQAVAASGVGWKCECGALMWCGPRPRTVDNDDQVG